MPKPSPKPVIRFKAKTLTPVNKLKRYKIRREPKIAETPTSNGMALATSAPKTNASNIKVRGIEIDSASAKSLEILELIASAKTPVPLA